MWSKLKYPPSQIWLVAAQAVHTPKIIAALSPFVCPWLYFRNETQYLCPITEWPIARNTPIIHHSLIPYPIASSSLKLTSGRTALGLGLYLVRIQSHDAMGGLVNKVGDSGRDAQLNSTYYQNRHGVYYL